MMALAVKQTASVLSKRSINEATPLFRLHPDNDQTGRDGLTVAWCMLSVAWLQRGARLNGACAVHTPRDEATED